MDESCRQTRPKRYQSQDGRTSSQCGSEHTVTMTSNSHCHTTHPTKSRAARITPSTTASPPTYLQRPIRLEDEAHRHSYTLQSTPTRTILPPRSNRSIQDWIEPYEETGRRSRQQSSSVTTISQANLLGLIHNHRYKLVS